MAVPVSWKDMPQPVRAAVQRYTGPVTETTDIAGGKNSDIALVLRDRRGRTVFLKGVIGVSRRMRWLRNEITAGKIAVGVAPTVLFHADVDGWLVVGFEHVPGRAVSLSPGSPDLSLVASVMEKISRIPALELRPLRDRWRVTDWWNKIAEEAPTAVDGWNVAEMSRWASLVPELVDGDRLLHTDLHGDQFRIGPSGDVHVIDWGFPAAGAAWVDIAFLVLRLVEAGHRPDDAEVWARSQACFAGVKCATLSAFSAYVAGLWSYWAITDDVPGAAHRARLAREYAAWRLSADGPIPH